MTKYCRTCGETKPTDAFASKKDRRDGLQAVDHCHETQAVRGILCHRCNRLLGAARDSVSVLMSAILYLEESSATLR